MCFVKILLTILGVVFAFLAVVLTVDALIVACSPVDIPGDCECDSNVTPYFILNDLTGGYGILVLLGMYGLAVLCFLKSLGGQRD